jgi:prolyl oligopeptidase PreP (S9A serine peptidase family)
LWRRRSIRRRDRRRSRPEKGRPAVAATSDGSLAERYWLTYVDFLTADSLALATAGSDVPRNLKRRPARFDPTGMRVEQVLR